MNRPYRILIAILVAFVLSLIPAIIFGQGNGLVIPGIAATLFIPLALVAVCIEEIIFGKKWARIIATLGLLIIGMLIWWFIAAENHEASIHYCNGKPVSQWTTPIPSNCGPFETSNPVSSDPVTIIHQ